MYLRNNVIIQLTECLPQFLELQYYKNILSQKDSVKKPAGIFVTYIVQQRLLLENNNAPCALLGYTSFS